MSAGAPRVAVLPARAGSPECRFCGAPLTPHQAVRGICGAPGCETRRVQEASRQVFQRDWQEYVDRQRLGVEAAAAQVASVVRELGEPPEKIAIGVVPFQSQPLAALPEARRAQFEAELGAIVAEAFEEGEPPEPDLHHRQAMERDEGALAGAACATCRGKCCTLGGVKTAFLKPETIQLYRWRHPGVTAGEVIAHYLSRLPDRSVEHSCYYHGERGCTLTRHERADVCNRYHCNPQSDLLRRFRAMGAKSAVIVANDDEAGPAVGVLDAAGWRRHTGADPDVSPELLGRTVAAAIAQTPPDMPGEGPSARPADPVCAWCGAPTDRHRAVTRQSCGKPACERRRVAEVTAEFERSRSVRHMAQVRRMRERHAAELDQAADAQGIAPEAVVLGVVPAVMAPLQPQSAERRAAFAAHLDEIVAAAFADAPDRQGGGAGDGRDRAAPEPSLMVSACTVCAGGCCRGGGEQAYLSATEILRLRGADPALTPRQVRDFFLARLPETSVRGSCIYHGPRGCGLPRTARSDTCNGFRCRGVSALLAEIGEAGAPAAVIVATDDDTPQRVAIVDADGAALAPGSGPGDGAIGSSAGQEPGACP